MTTPSGQPRTIRKLIVEVIDARDLLPKDGQGSSSPYVVVDFDGQKRRTSTVYRNLNPVWNEILEFEVSDPKTMEYEELEIDVFNDKKMSNGNGKKNHFLGRVKLYGSQFAKRGEEGLIYFQLEKKSVFSWIRGELGLRIYYSDETVEDRPNEQGQPQGMSLHPPPEQQQQQPQEYQNQNQPAQQNQVHVGVVVGEDGRVIETHQQPIGVVQNMPPVVTIQEAPPMVTVYPENQGHHQPQEMSQGMNPNPPQPQYAQPTVTVYPENQHHHHQPQEMSQGMNPNPPPQYAPPMVTVYPENQHHHQPQPQEVPQGMNPHPPPQYPPEVLKMQTERAVENERVRVYREPKGDYSPRVISGNLAGESERLPAYGLVEPMQFLFIRIVKARGITQNESPYVKIRTSSHSVRSKPAVYKSGEAPANPEWNQVFALAQNKSDSGNSTLEISVWDSPSERFLGGVCFDLSDVPVRDSPDSPLAPQWYRLEGGSDDPQSNMITGDLQLAVWIGTQTDDAFPESWSTDAPYVAYTRSKVYQSPKLWYLRVTVIEAQDLHIASNLPPLTAPEIRVKAQLGFQSVRTRRGSMNNHTSSFFWNEDLVFVAGEPLEENLILLVEDRTTKDPALLGCVMIPVASVEQRLDERHVASKWFALEGNPGGPPDGGAAAPYCGRIHMKLCLEGGYHVLDEAAHVCSDFRPTAKQLWKPPVGILELGILGARGLLPMKSKGAGKGSTDAYCVAKYGKKWVRTRTIIDSFDPRWNEQYTWQVYDPCTVLTIGVFDNWRMFADPAEDKPDYRVGKIRIRVSTLESNKVYTNSYPLLALHRSGLKKMGELEIAIRFACPSLLPETCAVYGQPMLPRMHYLRPLGLAQQEALRMAATKMVAAWLTRSEPPLGPEVVKYMLDADSHNWSMRKSKANWFRIVAVLAWIVGLAKWINDIRRWKNPITSVLVHLLYLVLVWYPDLIVPTGFLYIFLIGVWYYRFRPKIPAGMDTRLSQAETVDQDELDEEFDTIPSSRPSDVIRVRYDRLRILAARVQTVLGDFATQGERVQALVSWRDPRATKLFIGVCLVITIVLYVVPPKMVAVALGFYFLRHPMFREPMPPASLNFFRRLPSLSDRLM